MRSLKVLVRVKWICRLRASSITIRYFLQCVETLHSDKKYLVDAFIESMQDMQLSRVQLRRNVSIKMKTNTTRLIVKTHVAQFDSISNWYYRFSIISFHFYHHVWSKHLAERYIMINFNFDDFNFAKTNYDVNKSFEAIKLQRIVYKFMKLIRQDSINSKHSQQVDEFCQLIDDDDNWSLVEIMIFEFRNAIKNQ